MSRNKLVDLPKEYQYDKYGFIKQVEHHHFEYTAEYKEKQSTNVAMSHLRIGWLSAHMSCEQMVELDLVDVGCGNGVFIEACKGKFKSVCGYDVVGESISREELFSRQWGVVVLSDVLEHFEDIDDLFKMNWKYCLLSFPETPNIECFNGLKSWRHFKPNEHIYYLHLDGVMRWATVEHDAVVIAHGDMEDLIRTRWQNNKINISTVLLRRFPESPFNENFFGDNPLP